MVVTRPLEDAAGFGRVRTLCSIREALGTGFETTIFRLRNLLETHRIGDFAHAFWTGVTGLIRLRPRALQCLFYAPRSELERLANDIARGGFDAIYLDSVRCQSLLQALRGRGLSCRIVVDFDDLMSRRMQLLVEGRQPLSLGFVGELFPRWLRRATEGLFSALLARYEALALKQAEAEMASMAQAIVLVSSTESALLQQRLPRAAAQVHAIPPPSHAERTSIPVAPPFRFVFIGSDKLLQNRLSIEFLVELWRRLEPRSVLHIYGRQERRLPDARNVAWHGFVDEIREVYMGGSILLLPVLLAGGIKTKAIEAWAHGRPVLGNAAAFEGLDVEGYPLVLPETDWAPYVLTPERYQDAWSVAARIGNAFVRTELTQGRYTSSWVSVMTPAGAIAPLRESNGVSL